jgi:cysteine desulfurase
MGAYLDSATAMPLSSVARQAFEAASGDGWADPGRLYGPSRRSRVLADAARAAVAEVLGVRDDEVHFTAGGTDAVERAVKGVRAARSLSRVVYSAVEHSSVVKAAADDQRRSRSAEGVLLPGPQALGRAFDDLEVPVDRLGRVDIAAFADAVRSPGVALAALQSGNHEVGTLQPVAAAALSCADAGVPLLVDAAQSAGRVPVPDGWSLLVASARKWGGPAGVGVLVVRKGTRWEPMPLEPAVFVPAIVAAAASLRAAHAGAAAESARVSDLVDRIRAEVATIPDVEVVGDPAERLPHIVTFSCLYVDGETLLHELDRRGFAVSSGSACTADTLRPSHVLAAMGVLTHGNVRVSLHPGVSTADVDEFLVAVRECVERIRAEAGVVGL